MKMKLQPWACRALMMAAMPLMPAHALAERYVAELRPLNAGVVGRAAEGTATFEVENGQLNLSVQAKGLAPGVMHLQHTHGFPKGGGATCPTAAADANRDGYVDLRETEATAGTTMIPLHGMPQSLEIPADSYPVADAKGEIHYRHSVRLAKLTSALKSKFGVAEPAFGDRVVFLHGTAADAKLPDSVASLPGVPARVTLPVACGAIRRVD